MFISAFILSLSVTQYLPPTQPFPGQGYNQAPIMPYVAPHFDNGGFHQGEYIPPSYNNGFQGGYNMPHYETPSFDNGGSFRPYNEDHYYDSEEE